MNIVKISVVDGVACVDQVPAGIMVQISDYDVDAHTRERDEAGRPCSRYTVTAENLRAWAAAPQLAKVA
jgi:hypothetical protein